MGTELTLEIRTMSIIYSHYVEFDDIFINNTGNIYQSCETMHWQLNSSKNIFLIIF